MSLEDSSSKEIWQDLGLFMWLGLFVMVSWLPRTDFVVLS